MNFVSYKSESKKFKFKMNVDKKESDTLKYFTWSFT